MTNAQQEIQAVIDDLSAKIVDLEKRTAALKDVREYAQAALAKYSIVGITAQAAIEFEDKELPSSGIYSDDTGYTAEDKHASTVFELADALKDAGDKMEALRAASAKNPNAGQEYSPCDCDLQAASLVNDALDPALVELCSNTTIHADKDGWIRHVGDECPVEAFVRLEIKLSDGRTVEQLSNNIDWTTPESKDEEYWRVTHWRYPAKNKPS